MAANLTRLTHKIAIQLHLVQKAEPFAVLVPGGQSRNFWIHPHTFYCHSVTEYFFSEFRTKLCVLMACQMFTKRLLLL